MSGIPLAFYAPMKSPDHPTPSGDRTMARLLVGALRVAGFEPTVMSELRSWEGTGNPVRQREIAVEARREAERLARDAVRPRLWFTYHNYYKAPDHLGPVLARRWGVPYALAEATRARKRAGGPWHDGHVAAEAANDAADLVLAMTEWDRAAWEETGGPRLVDLPPFLDTSAWPEPEPRSPTGRTVRLLAVGMMREGDKLASYLLLADALSRLPDRGWTLDVAGDGPARAAVEAAFAPFGGRIRMHGAIPPETLRELYAAADLLVWPAVNEAYGMVLLEAQAMGCPVLAGAYGGVRSAMKPGVTGVLAPPGDAETFARELSALILDPDRRARYGRAGSAFVRGKRDLPSAAAILREALLPLIERAPSCPCAS